MMSFARGADILVATAIIFIVLHIVSAQIVFAYDTELNKVIVFDSDRIVWIYRKILKPQYYTSFTEHLSLDVANVSKMSIYIHNMTRTTMRFWGRTNISMGVFNKSIAIIMSSQTYFGELNVSLDLALEMIVSDERIEVKTYVMKTYINMSKSIELNSIEEDLRNKVLALPEIAKVNMFKLRAYASNRTLIIFMTIKNLDYKGNASLKPLVMYGNIDIVKNGMLINTTIKTFKVEYLEYTVSAFNTIASFYSLLLRALRASKLYDIIENIMTLILLYINLQRGLLNNELNLLHTLAQDVRLERLELYVRMDRVVELMLDIVGNGIDKEHVYRILELVRKHVEEHGCQYVVLPRKEQLLFIPISFEASNRSIPTRLVMLPTNTRVLDEELKRLQLVFMVTVCLVAVQTGIIIYFLIKYMKRRG